MFMFADNEFRWTRAAADCSPPRSGLVRIRCPGFSGILSHPQLRAQSIRSFIPSPVRKLRIAADSGNSRKNSASREIK